LCCLIKIAAAEHPGVDYDSAESIPSQDEEEDDDLDGSKVKLVVFRFVIFNLIMFVIGN
jgi:hypothetical protein